MAASGIKLVVFDMDGTLTCHTAIDFAKMRRRSGVPDGQDILKYVASLEPVARAAAENVLHEVEIAARDRTTLNPGCEDMLCSLRELGLPCGILTRNTDSTMNWTLDTFSIRHHFEPGWTISRDWSGGRPKPSGDAIRHLAELAGVHSSEVLMVGDMKDDIAAGRDAGAKTCLVKHDNNGHLHTAADFAVDELHHLIDIARNLVSDLK